MAGGRQRLFTRLIRRHNGVTARESEVQQLVATYACHPHKFPSVTASNCSYLTVWIRRPILLAAALSGTLYMGQEGSDKVFYQSEPLRHQVFRRKLTTTGRSSYCVFLNHHVKPSVGCNQRNDSLHELVCIMTAGYKQKHALPNTSPVAYLAGVIRW